MTMIVECFRLLKVGTINCYHMGGTIVLTLIEALLIVLALLISKAIRFISPSLYCDQLVAADVSTKDDVILTQKASPPSSHIVVSPPATKYDVFLSFRGEDTRHTFASYLYKGLCNAGIHTFMDYELRKGENISQVLLRTIEESEISMIIFSDNYASSTWCLDELVHILECKENFGRIVIPIFYNIDPSNIRKQNGSFGNGFNELKRRFKDNPEKSQKWINALGKAASLSGWDSKNTRPEFEFVEKIVKDALSKLNYNASCHHEGLVGIARHIRNIENHLSEAHIAGIWGMDGAGKTTLARAIFQELKAQFDAFSFIENVKKRLKKIGLDKLQQNCLKELLKDKEIGVYDIKSTFVKSRLGRTKILLILDDVDDSRIAKDLTNWIYWFGEGSKIIITSRDMQVLKKADAFSYHVPELDFYNSLHLFSLKAFNEHDPSECYMDLSISVVKYCQGNPLALDVLGCFLYGREKEEWKSALEKLDKDPPKDVVDVLKLSFDGLDEEQQNVFLDLAFLINERVDISLNRIRQLYDSSRFIEISVLKEKSLISFNNDGAIVMHNLVKKMGLKIVRNQLISDAKTPIRLWQHEDIAGFFNCGKGIEAIRCLSLDMSKTQNITLRASIFRKMLNLIFLKIYKSDWKKPLKLNICGVLGYLSKELRFLSWEECPLPFVPLHFCAENLITLEMRDSNIRLWNRNLNFPNLETIDLSLSEHLTALDFSHTPKIKEIRLDGCVNLSQIHSSTFYGEDVNLWMLNCGPMQIKVGGSIKGRSSGFVSVYRALNLEELSLDRVTMKVLVCGNMIYGVRFKHEAMPLESKKLRKCTRRLRSLLPFVSEVEWFDGPIEFGHDLNQHYDYANYFSRHDSDYYDGDDDSDDDSDYYDGDGDGDEEERGNRGEMMNKHQVVTKSLMEDDEGDDVLMEDCCSKSVSVSFTRVPNSITRWSLLKELTLKSLTCSNKRCKRMKRYLDVTLSFPHIPLPDILPTSPQASLSIHYVFDFITSPRSHFFNCLRFNGPPDSIYAPLGLEWRDYRGVINGLQAKIEIERKRGIKGMII